MALVELPFEILGLIYSFLDVPSFLKLSRTCKALYQPNLRFDAAFWSNITRSTFRLPNRPNTELSDGERWQTLYRRLLTQSTVYTWGKSQKGNLGRKVEMNAAGSAPQSMDRAKEVGIIADLQCGGWSTSILSAKGAIYVAGVFDARIDRPRAPRPRMLRGRGLIGLHHSQPEARPPSDFNLLEYPHGFVNPAERYEPSTAIRQLSSGRRHILGLSDTGIIWSWYSELQPAIRVKFMHVTTNDHDGPRDTKQDLTALVPRGTVQKVSAGWGESSAYVSGTGIVVWNIATRPGSHSSETGTEDILLIPHTAVVPFTNFKRLPHASTDTDDLAAAIGAVVNYAMLSDYIVFITDIGRVYASKMSRAQGNDDEIRVTDAFELQHLRSSQPNPTCDIQGSFRTFGIFVDGKVIIQHEQDILDVERGQWNDRSIRLYPALQNSGVIQMAFGDYHFHALHIDGSITSYDKESEGLGQLGLGEPNRPEATAPLLRGLRSDGPPGFAADRMLSRTAEDSGRHIWFDSCRRDWLRQLANGGIDMEEAAERFEFWKENAQAQHEVSEWIEQESRKWESSAMSEDDGLGTAYALSVAAAGWHSGALVLVNEPLIAMMEKNTSLKQTFPRLRLSDGTEMPGRVPFDN